MQKVRALPFEPFEPKFVEENKDFTEIEVADGIRLIHARNPLNDLFTLEVRMEEGYRHQPMLPYAKMPTARGPKTPLPRSLRSNGTNSGPILVSESATSSPPLV